DGDREEPGGEGMAASEGGEVGPQRSARHAADRMAADTGASREDRLAFRGQPGRLGQLGLLRGDPARERVRRVDDDTHAHVGVRDPAELGALSAILAWSLGGERESVQTPGNDVALA